MKKLVLFVGLSLILSVSFSQDKELLLWPAGTPNQHESEEKEAHINRDVLIITNVQDPNIAVFLPKVEVATGQAVVVCPGGGYRGLAYAYEGSEIAEVLNEMGIAAIVLKYRLPDSKSLIKPNEAPLQDAQRAIRMVRYHAEKWNIDKNKVGVMGFSAGGHLASTLGTHFDFESLPKQDSIDCFSARPDFMILIYPVITFNEEFTHGGSRWSLLGDNPSQELINFYSNEQHVTETTPPTFIVHASDDDAVPVENSILFYKALQENNISTEMHLYPKGGHGFALALEMEGYLRTWTERLNEWMQNLM